MSQRVDETTAECLIFTEREGLLGAMGHDLKLRVTRFSIEGDAAARHLAARFDAASLVVVAALRDGAEDPAALSESNRREIEVSSMRSVRPRLPSVSVIPLQRSGCSL